MIPLGDTIRSFRLKLKLTQRELSQRVGVSVVHICNIENGKSSPSSELLERLDELWGVNLYVLAWCQHGDVKKLPSGMRRAAAELTKAWKEISPELFE
jgi:transcriptional regulator with XRE-family HTH domain